MSFFSDLLTGPTLTAVRAQIIAYAQAAGLAVTNWRVGDVVEQILEVITSARQATGAIEGQIVRGFASLDTSVDPGDEDAYDAGSIARTPEPGFLSNLGLNTYSTERGEATFATGFATFINAGTSSRAIAPGGLVYTWTANSPPDPAPTYTTSADATVYTNPDETLTVAPGVTVTLPITCDIVGSYGSCPAASLTLTTVLLGCSGTNAAAVLGTDREDAAVYRARCKLMPARLSFGAPGAIYKYLAAKNLDGTVLQNALENDVNINRVQVVGDSTTGIVDAYYAAPAGAAIAEDVTAANENISEEAFAVPDTITFTGEAASEVAIHVVGTAKLKTSTGVSAATVKAAIVAALAAAFEDIPIGGMDQTAGAGVIYTSDIEGYARDAWPGLYDVNVTTPAGASTALAVGDVATVTSTTSDWTVTFT